MSATFIISAVLLISSFTASNGLPLTSNATCSQAADIIFLVDTSSSIWPGYYPNIKTFLKDVIGSFKVGPGPLDSRVAVLTFSTRESLEFHLNRYQKTEHVLKAVDNIKFRPGDTYTHRALEFVSNVMLTREHGARDDVNKVIVILTDGKSANTKKTLESAAAIKAKGVSVFAIGVGTAVDFQELSMMSSGPSDQFVFQVTDYRVLDSIKNIFTQTTCHVLATTTAAPTTTVTSTVSTTTVGTTASSTTTLKPTMSTTPVGTTTVTPTTASPTTTLKPTMSTTTVGTTTLRATTKLTTKKPIVKTTERLPKDEPDFDEECKGKPADIYFLLDASSSVWIGHFNDRVLPFVRDLVSSFQISPLHTRVGLVTYSTDVNYEFGLSEHDNLESLLAAIQPEHVEYLTGGTNTGDAIKFVTEKGFGSEGVRQDVAQIIITVTDGLSQEPLKTAQAAQEAREKGIYMFAVGVGHDVEEKELSDISSDPDEDFVFSVDDFKALSSVTRLLAQKTCKAVSNDDSNRPPVSECSQMMTNVIFAYDSRHSIFSSNMIVQVLVSNFINEVAVAASRIKVGILTQPCVGDAAMLQSVSELRKFLNGVISSYSIEFHNIVKQLRTDIFSHISQAQHRIAVLIVDDMTKNLEQLQEEVLRLKFMNIKIVVVAVGKVEQAVLEQLASDTTTDFLLRLDDYSNMRDVKLNIFRIVCGKSSNDSFNFTERRNESPTKYVDNTNNPTLEDKKENKDEEDENLTNTISLSGSVKQENSKVPQSVKIENGSLQNTEYNLEESEADNSSELATKGTVTFYYEPR